MGYFPSRDHGYAGRRSGLMAYFRGLCSLVMAVLFLSMLIWFLKREIADLVCYFKTLDEGCFE